MSDIPQKVRIVVDAREQGRCLRCGGRGTDIHHRKRRREGGHGLANCILLCRTCHQWAHANPLLAREQGFIVRANNDDDPAQTLVRAWWGWTWLTENGAYRPTPVGFATTDPVYPG